MDPVLQSIQEYIKSEEYFADAKKWYGLKYLYPLLQRSILLISSVIFILLLTAIGIKLDSLFPIVK